MSLKWSINVNETASKVKAVVSAVFENTDCCSDECGNLVKIATKSARKLFPRATRGMSEIEKEQHKRKKEAFMTYVSIAIAQEVEKIEKRERLALGGRV